MYIDDIKLYTKYENELETLMQQIIIIYCQNMGYGVRHRKICHHNNE